MLFCGFKHCFNKKTARFRRNTKKQGSDLSVQPFDFQSAVVQMTFYSAIYGATDGSKAFAKTAFEASPLNRVLKQGAPRYHSFATSGKLSVVCNDKNKILVTI